MDRICAERHYTETQREILRALMKDGWGDFSVTDKRPPRSGAMARVPAAKREGYRVEVWFAASATRYRIHPL